MTNYVLSFNFTLSEPTVVAVVGNPQSLQAIKSITISGKVPLEHYIQVFQSFILPLAQNNIEIEIRIKAKSTSAKLMTTSSQEYKIVKESAKQLGLNFEEEQGLYNHFQQTQSYYYSLLVLGSKAYIIISNPLTTVSKSIGKRFIFANNLQIT